MVDFSLNTLNISLHFLFACVVSEILNVTFNLCSSTGKVFVSSGFFQDFFPLPLMFCNLKIIFPGIFLFFLISCLVFSELPRCMVWFLTLIWGKFSVIMVSDISSVPFSLYSPSDIPITHMLHLLQFFHSPWIFCCFFFFFSLCSLYFSMLKVLLIYLQTQKFFSSAVSGLLTSPSKAFFISVTVFLISSISFWFFLQDFHFFTYITHVLLHSVKFIHYSC